MAKPRFLTLRGGKLRGKKIPVPIDGSVRPTTDRAREQAFNLLDQHFRHADGRARWVGASVLDAFAGTGALGLEVLSRGAGHVMFWDTSARQISALQSVLRDLRAQGADVARQSALTPPSAKTPSDLILLDPPYGKGWVDQCLTALGQAGWIGENTLIYAETETGCPAPLGFDVVAERQSAQSILRLLKQACQSASER